MHAEAYEPEAKGKKKVIAISFTEIARIVSPIIDISILNDHNNSMVEVIFS